MNLSALKRASHQKAIFSKAPSPGQFAEQPTRAGSHPSDLPSPRNRSSCLRSDRLIDRRKLPAAPGVESVIDHQPVTQDLVVIGKIRRQSERYRVKPIALRSELA